MAENLIADFVESLKTEEPKQTASRTATVTRVDKDGTVWVSVAGSDRETPTASTASEVKRGDTVTVEWRNNRLHVSGNQTDPAASVGSVHTVAKSARKAGDDAKAAQDTADTAKKIAGNTNQYFWMTSTGTDTGAHITEIPQSAFLADPQGGNLLARSNGIAVRDGLTELATFGADGATIGLDGTYQTYIYAGGFTVSDGTGYNAFSMEPSDETISRGYSKTLKLIANGNDDHIRTQAPLDKCSVTFTVTSATPNVSATYTNSTFAVEDVKSLGTTVGLHRRSQTMFDVFLRNAASSATVKITYTMPASATTAKLTFSGANNPLFTSTGNWMRDTDAINLSEPISMQLTGIVIAWSEYADGETKNYGWKYTYIPKNSVLLNENQGVICGPFATTGFGYVGNKYLYIADTRIVGHANNIATGTASSGIKYDNSHWVLRYVWGV